MMNVKLFNLPTGHAVALKSIDQNLQLNSTSGGAFTLIAKSILSNNGVVYGASYNDDFTGVIHTRVCSEEMLGTLRNSKYVQSKMGDTLNHVKCDLEQRKDVLFTGTSCQIAGLKTFLGKEYDGLLLVDVLCHGIPSPMVWEYYVNAVRKKYGEINSIVQKGKKEGGWSWKKQFMHITFTDGHELNENIWDNSYILGFLKDLYLRPCCHECAFKNEEISRVSDLTIADYWGCEEIEKEFFSGNGVSLVLVNTAKGKEVLESLHDCLQKETDLSKAGWHNQALFHSYTRPLCRKDFFKRFHRNLNLNEFENLVKNCLNKEKNNILFKVIRKVNRLIGR